jgi:purine nucleoside permease
MRFPRRLTAIIAGLNLIGLILIGAAPAVAAPCQAKKATTHEPCAPGTPCAHPPSAHPLPVRIVIVTLFEIGKDSGDAPGEFQLWKERRHLDTRIPFPQSYHDLYYNPDSRILGMVTGVGNIRSATAMMALGLDPRFDLRHAYVLVAGIAGIDPHRASIGSAAWARFLVDGDLAHEIDAREIPKDWKTGYFPLDRKGPNDPAPARPNGEMFEINAGLRDWAYALTRDVALPDDATIAAERARFTGYPAAQRPPFVLKGDNLAAMTFWHGARMNAWAQDWVRYWTAGKGTFVTSAMEETGAYQSILYLDRIGRVDKDRFMVLRAGSNYTMPPPGVDPAAYLLRENEGYAGLNAALESLYRVGSRVIDELGAHWDRYEHTVPRSPPE